MKLENFTYPDRFGKLLGYKPLSLDREEWTAEAELVIREDHLSPAQKVHGGVIAAFFDYACGMAVFSTLGAKDFCSTVEIKVNYFKPLLLNDHLIARTKVMFRGKRLCVVEGLLYRGQEEEPVAMTVGTFNVVSPTK